MKKVFIVIGVVTLFMLVYNILPFVASIDSRAIFAMFMAGQFAIVFMAVYILKYGKPSTKKFSDGHWYEDKLLPLEQTRNA